MANDEGRLKYLGQCVKCKIAMYREHGAILTAGKSDCQHVLRVEEKMYERKFFLRLEEDAYLAKRAKQNKCTRGEYLRTLISADRKIIEGGA